MSIDLQDIGDRVSGAHTEDTLERIAKRRRLTYGETQTLIGVVHYLENTVMPNEIVRAAVAQKGKTVQFKYTLAGSEMRTDRHDELNDKVVAAALEVVKSANPVITHLDMKVDRRFWLYHLEGKVRLPDWIRAL